MSINVFEAFAAHGWAEDNLREIENGEKVYDANFKSQEITIAKELVKDAQGIRDKFAKDFIMRNRICR